MNPNACVKSLNSNMRCRCPFTTLQPSSVHSPAAISCFDNFPLVIGPPLPSGTFKLIHSLSGTVYRVRGRTRSVGAFWSTSRSRAELAMRGAAISLLTRERTSLYGSFFAFFFAMYHDLIKTKAIQFNPEQGAYKTEVDKIPIRRRRISRRRLAE